jgi:hypothetical protein
MAESKPRLRLGTPQKHLPTCGIHASELIDIFCENCDTFICTDCAKTDHKDHNWVTVVKAASQRRRQLLRFIQTIKDEKIQHIEDKIQNASIEMKEIEKQGAFELEKLQEHFNVFMMKLTDIKTRHDKTLSDNVIERCGQVNCLKTQYEEQKTALVDMVKLMEENNSTMSDYKFINQHRELSQLVSAVDVNTEICKFPLRYTSRNIGDEELGSLMGQVVDFKDISAKETNSFQCGDAHATTLNAFSENECYITFLKSNCIERINKQGDEKQKYNADAVNDFCARDTGDVYFTDLSPVYLCLDLSLQ